VRVASYEGEPQVEQLFQLWRHQPEQVGAGRLLQVRHVAERLLGASRAADHVVALDDDDRQPGPREQSGCDETVVPGADHHDVGPTCQHVSTL
jgi:hypothetical protein